MFRFVSATAQQAARIVRTADELEPEWLAQALGSGPLEGFATEQIGTGQMSESHRVTLRYREAARAGPASVVLKLASADQSSRSTGVGLGIYEREVRFYQELAPRLHGPLAGCHLALYDSASGWFTLLLEDVTPALAGDQIAGCSREQARTVLLELARLQAPVLEERSLAQREWLNSESGVNGALVAQLLPAFLARYGERVSPEHASLCKRFAPHVDAWLARRRPPLGLVHGDFRLDNLLFGQPGSPRPVTAVDWQTVGWGGAMADAAYFVAGGLSPEERRACERELFAEYHEALCRAGMRNFSLEHCWREYRHAAFGGVLMAIVASMLVQRTERGDEMFVAMLARHSQQALDLESESLLDDGAAVAPPPRPRASDEHPHAPGPEQLWNESWYFDAVLPDESLGVYVRLGLYPNLGVSWYTAFVCGPDRPTVAVVDLSAPPPGADGLALRTPQLRAEQRCTEALARYDLTLSATGRAHPDAAGLLRGSAGEPLPVELELAWQTAGTPYEYRLATRYEIPCLVNGQIRIGEQTFAVAGASGQRDHSWGVRDWWSMDWVWSALHLQDGTHVHAVQLRLPGAAPLAVGYVQGPRAELVELHGVLASERVDERGLISAARLELEPGGLALEIEPLAFGPLRLISPDGRISHFPRAMCRVRAADGRSGVGWMEWNLNQREPRGAG
jgi:hypothetical protein